MNLSRAARALCILLSAILLAFPISAQPPAAETPRDPIRSRPEPIPGRLTIFILEGNNSINSISLGRSVSPVVEVRDQNEFPVEGATVVFTVPETGPGGAFPGKQSSFTTRSDATGQASAPFLANGLTGKFQIKVTATSNNRTGEALITQTNSTGAYVGPVIPTTPYYKKWPFWLIVGGAAAAATTAFLLLNDNTSASSLIITPGGPVFGAPR